MSILEFLSHRERSVTELQRATGVPQSTMSYHLKVLRDSGLVRERRDGRWKFFALRPDTLAHMSEFSERIGPGKHEWCPLTCCR